MSIRALLMCASLATVACGSSSHESLSPEDARGFVENRNWLDVWPTSADEKLLVYRFTPSMGGGVFQDRTLFAGQFELFTYELSDETIRITWPHDGTTESIGYTVKKVSGPEPFDLSLVLAGNRRGPSVFFGRTAETGTVDLEVSLRASVANRLSK